MPGVTDSSLTRVALVTGCARRLGAEIARHLHGSGMNLALHYRTSRDAARELCDEFNDLRPASAQLFEADLRLTRSIEELVASVTNTFTRLDALINNASVFYPTPFGAIDENAYQDVMDTNLKAPLFLTQAAAPQLSAAGGCVVNVADIYGIRPLAEHAAYCAAKAGLIMLTRALALELAPDVRVNAVAPGAILWPENGADDDAMQKILAGIPMGRTGEPADIAQTVLFLVRDAHYMTGQTIKVDGGRVTG